MVASCSKADRIVRELESLAYNHPNYNLQTVERICKETIEYIRSEEERRTMDGWEIASLRGHLNWGA